MTTRILKDLISPLRSLAVMGIAAATFGAIPTSSSSAQGVWAESDCGAEVACATEPACGVEVSCGAEIACGAESGCGVEVSCGCERPYRHAAACGCGVSNCSELLCPEEGLLANVRMPQCGLIHGGLDLFAGGMKKMVLLHPLGRRPSRSTCDCSSCQHPSSVQYAHVQQAPCSTCQPTMAADLPTLSAESSVTSDFPTLDEHKSTAPPSASDESPAAKTKRSQPGQTFDQLGDPFQDDSASNMIAGKAAVMQTTFADEVATSPKGATKVAPRSDSDYADYFRR